MQQYRPLTMEGLIGAKKYMGENVFLLDREHPDEALRGAAERVLVGVGGFAPGRGGPGAPTKITEGERECLTEMVCQALADLAGLKGEKLHRAREKARGWVAAHKDLLVVLAAGRQRTTDTLAVTDLPRFLCLAPELSQEADLDIRESHRALYEALALEIRGCRPDLATPAMILAHLRALRGGASLPTMEDEQARTPAPPAPAVPAAAAAAAPPTPSAQPAEPRARGGRLRVRDPKALGHGVDPTAPVVRDPQPAALEAVPTVPAAAPAVPVEAFKIPEGMTTAEFFKKGPVELAALVPGPEANRGEPSQRLDPGTAGGDVQLGAGEAGGRIKLKRFQSQ